MAPKTTASACSRLICCVRISSNWKETRLYAKYFIRLWRSIARSYVRAHPPASLRLPRHNILMILSSKEMLCFLLMLTEHLIAHLLLLSKIFLRCFFVLFLSFVICGGVWTRWHTTCACISRSYFLSFDLFAHFFNSSHQLDSCNAQHRRVIKRKKIK